MKRVINEEDIKKADNTERCRLLIAIIKRTSNIHTRYKNSLRSKKYKRREKEQEYYLEYSNHIPKID